MILTLGPNSIHRILSGDQPSVNKLLDVPSYCQEELGLRGMTVPASLLAGWEGRDIDHLRDRADKSCCPCLLLMEEKPLPLASSEGSSVDSALDRIDRLLRAAHRLGSNSIAIFIDSPDNDDAMNNAIAGCRAAMELAERLEINILVGSYEGLTQHPDRLTHLIKKSGGFRIGTYPDYLAAEQFGDSETYLRRLSPYSGSVNSSFVTGKEDIAGMTRAVLGVGFAGAIGIDYRGSLPVEKQLKNARDVIQGVAAEVKG